MLAVIVVLLLQLKVKRASVGESVFDSPVLFELWIANIFVIVLLISLFVWHNTTFEMNGQKVNLKDAAYEFWYSKEMEKICEILRVAWNFYRAHGISIF